MSSNDIILVVDDCEQIRILLQTILRRIYKTVLTANDGLEAYSLCKIHHPSLIIADVNMPECDGYELASKLREDPDFHFTPIIFLSAQIKISDQQKAYLAGGDHYFCKPLHGDQKALFMTTIQSLLDRSHQRRQLFIESKKDHLTGLPRRDSFYNDTSTKRNSTAYTLAILDIDKFKNINDTYGHNVGDIVIKTFSNIVASNLRLEDKIYRYGGEEFVIAFVNTNVEQAKQGLQRIKDKIKEHIFPEGFSISFSSGICALTDHETLESCIEKADMALYKAKQSGRDRIEIYECQ